MTAVLIGYAASVLLAISLLVTNELRFRWLNLSGCLAFIVYGTMINAFPIIVTNTILLLINAFYLVKTYRTRENFDLLAFAPGDPFIAKFLSFYANDIENYYPGFQLVPGPRQVSFAVLRDMVIANVFVAEVLPDGTAEVRINYTVPKYRDYKVGTFLFRKEKQYLTGQGIQRILYRSVASQAHQRFLRKMGFDQQNGYWVKTL